MQCGREPGGEKTEELGVCPAATDVSHDGLNNGKNGGRICWTIAGTLCGGKVQGIFAEKIGSCFRCEFFKDVRREEGAAGFRLRRPTTRYYSGE
jgi:hypothetical protein